MFFLEFSLIIITFHLCHHCYIAQCDTETACLIFGKLIEISSEKFIEINVYCGAWWISPRVTCAINSVSSGPENDVKRTADRVGLSTSKKFCTSGQGSTFELELAHTVHF